MAEVNQTTETDCKQEVEEPREGTNEMHRTTSIKSITGSTEEELLAKLEEQNR